MLQCSVTYVVPKFYPNKRMKEEKETACIFNECCCLCPSGPVVYVLDLADRLISKAGPFAAAGIMVGSIYWTAVTYGAVTVMQV